jgi:hypothetical protein
MDLPTLYIIDASSLISLGRHRPANRYVRVWQRLDELIHNGRLISPDEVYDELRAGNDALAVWAKKCKREKRLFRRTTAQVAGAARQLVSRFPDFVDVDRPIPQADPFVVALAVAESKKDLLAPPCAVITEEKFTFTGKPRLPSVCGSCKMPYLTLHQMFINEGWSF